MEIVVASDDHDQVRRLVRDVQASKYAYAFRHLAVRERLLETAAKHIFEAGAKMPVVVVLDYRFLGADCEILLEELRGGWPLVTVACVVIGAPEDAELRERLVRLGADIFDEDLFERLPQFSLH